MYAGIEGRGTEFLAVVGTGPDRIVAEARFPATTPEETLGAVVEFLAPQPIRAAGIACFGPLDLVGGRVTYTLKPGWQGFAIVDTVAAGLGVPVVLDTDVNAAAVAEAHRRGRDNLLFITIGSGTGIGAGALVDGRPIHGLSHPEMGHLPVTRHPDDPMPGRCPYHGDCLEGLATSAAMVQRWGVPVERMPPAAIELEAFYLAQLATAATYMLSPEIVVLGGAVAGLPGMLGALREATLARLSGDPAVAPLTADIDSYVDTSDLGGQAAVLGALILATRLEAPEDFVDKENQ